MSSYQQHDPQAPVHQTGPTGAPGTGMTGAGQGQPQGHGQGVTEKIKEKMPGGGGGHKDQPSHDTATGTYGTEQHQEKKGMVDKVKEKLPGTH